MEKIPTYQITPPHFGGSGNRGLKCPNCRIGKRLILGFIDLGLCSPTEEATGVASLGSELRRCKFVSHSSAW